MWFQTNYKLHVGTMEMVIAMCNWWLRLFWRCSPNNDRTSNGKLRSYAFLRHFKLTMQRYSENFILSSLHQFIQPTNRYQRIMWINLKSIFFFFKKTGASVFTLRLLKHLAFYIVELIPQHSHEDIKPFLCPCSHSENEVLNTNSSPQREGEREREMPVIEIK